MKPHISGESSVANELRRSVGEKLHHVDDAADAAKQGRLLKYNQTERRRRRSHRAEDPIRTLMFLGSINHT
uniref:Uncharacterized protein n=2 Tax=Cajanus cajan TaxID=3821 RepID=A0A151RAC7_CAJCA|nr:hypothetical protein KK1_039165 [Cajanus cajan]